jgi:Protein of unknown function (DUF2721)
MNATDADIALIAHVIQLAVAPVFLISGIGALLSVAVTRLNRVIDRSRLVEGSWKQLDDVARATSKEELMVLARRARLASWSINAFAAAALLVCLVIATLFIDAFFGTRLRWIVGLQFILSMFILVFGLTCFLREVYFATHTLRIGPPA